MNIRILFKICDRIQILEANGHFIVQAREKLLFRGFTMWHNLNQYGSLKHALNKKHSYIIMVLMRELGLRNTLILRRKARKKAKALRS